MLKLSQNAELCRVAQEVRSELDAATERRACQIVDALRKRRERDWNRRLGRRADGHVIRPIPRWGRFRFAPVVTPEQRALIVERIRQQLVEPKSCESCGDVDAHAAYVFNPMGHAHYHGASYWTATLCLDCQHALNAPGCQRDILQQEVEAAERAAGWVA